MEIITVQIGPNSNNIATHYWNTQAALLEYKNADFNKRSLFVERKGRFLPRSVIFESTGGFRSVNKSGETGVPQQASSATWQGRSTRIDQGGSSSVYQRVRRLIQLESAVVQARAFGQQLPSQVDAKKKKLQQLKTEVANLSKDAVTGAERLRLMDAQYDIDDIEQELEMYYKISNKTGTNTAYDFGLSENTVKHWSDYVNTEYHPKSLYAMNGVRYGDDFDFWQQGHEITKDVDQLDEMIDRVRYFAEECDHMQGIQLFADIHNGWGGVTSVFLEEIRKEYGNTPVLLWAYHEKKETAKQLESYYLNTGLCLHSLRDFATFIVPVSNYHLTEETFPYLASLSSSYHSSAVISAAIDNATLPFRLDKNATPMHRLLQQLGSIGESHNIGALDVGFPFPMGEEESLEQALNKNNKALPESDLISSLYPFVTKTKVGQLTESIMLRGLEPYFQTSKNYKSSYDLFDNYFGRYKCLVRQRASEKQCFVLSPAFPQMFTPDVSVVGRILPKDFYNNGGRSVPLKELQGQKVQPIVKGVNLMTRMNVSENLGYFLYDISKNAEDVNVGVYSCHDIEDSMRDEMTSELIQVSERYDTDIREKWKGKRVYKANIGF